MIRRLLKSVVLSVSCRDLDLKSARQNREWEPLRQQRGLPPSAGSTVSSASNWLHRGFQIVSLGGPWGAGVWGGKRKVVALKQRPRPNPGTSAEGLTELHLFKTPSTFGLLKKSRQSRGLIVASHKIHPATPTFHILILAPLSFCFTPPPPAAARRNWVKLLVKRAYEKSGKNVTSTAIYDESAVPRYRSVRARRARQSANK